MCNHTEPITISTNNDSNEHSDYKMPITVDEPIKDGPFAEFASERVLSKLGAFQDSIESSYRHFLPQNKVPLREAGTIEWTDVSIESVLGEGGFSFIFKVTLKAEPKDHNEFALKCLKAKAIESEDDLEFNAMDLYSECYLLSRLNHKNIIGIHGVINATLADSYLSDGYFILLDIMQITLFDALEVWREKNSRVSRSKAVIAIRVQNIIYPVVEALQYLHQHDIVLRDLKPENVGFDHAGQVKLFDFGLARHLSTIQDDEIAGSICYMAPEVMLKEDYSFPCDVYSFAILLWEVCTLNIPLADFADMEEVERKVAKGGWRPSTTWLPSKTIRSLLKDCWARDPKARPNFESVEKTLQKSCNKVDGVADRGKQRSISNKSLSSAMSKSANTTTLSFSDLYLEALANAPRKGR